MLIYYSFIGKQKIHLRDATGKTAMNMILERQNDQVLNLIASKTITSLEETKAHVFDCLNKQVFLFHILERVPFDSNALTILITPLPCL